MLALLTVTGHKIPEVVVIGAQPYDLSAGVGLSDGMARLLPHMAEQALAELRSWGIVPKEKDAAEPLDFHVVAEEAVREGR